MLCMQFTIAAIMIQLSTDVCLFSNCFKVFNKSWCVRIMATFCDTRRRRSYKPRQGTRHPCMVSHAVPAVWRVDCEADSCVGTLTSPVVSWSVSSITTTLFMVECCVRVPIWSSGPSAVCSAARQEQQANTYMVTWYNFYNHSLDPGKWIKATKTAENVLFTKITRNDVRNLDRPAVYGQLVTCNRQLITYWQWLSSMYYTFMNWSELHGREPSLLPASNIAYEARPYSKALRLE